MTARVATLASALLVSIACGGSNTSPGSRVFDATPVQSVRSASGALLVAVHAEAGHPPARGVNAFRYVVTDGGGGPVDGLHLTVTPWMPDMGHGSSVSPAVTAAGGGAYLVTDVYFAMPGRWELNSNFTGPVTDAAKPTFQIQ